MSNLDERFDEVARNHGVCLLFLRADAEAFGFQLEGPARAIVLDLEAPDLSSRLRQEGLLNPSLSPSILGIARQLTQTGVQERLKGNLPRAYLFYRFAFFAAAAFQDIDGLGALARNIWVLRDAIYEITKRAGGPLRDPDASEEEQKAVQRYGQSLLDTDRLISRDAAEVMPLLQSLVEDLTNDIVNIRLPVLLALFRVIILSGNGTAHRTLFQEIFSVAERINSYEVPLLASLEELVNASLMPVIEAAGLLKEEVEGTSLFLEAWQFYSKNRHRINTIMESSSSTEAKEILEDLYIAFKHFDYLRFFLPRQAALSVIVFPTHFLYFCSLSAETWPCF